MNEINPDQVTPPKKKYSFLLPLAFAIVMIVGVQLGIFISRASNGSAGSTSGATQYSKLNEIINYVNQKYVDTLNSEQLEEDIITSYLSKLDPHSVYIPRREMEEVDEDMQGNFEGVGIEFRIVADTLLVANAISGGPSELAGIKSGDKIIKINDTIVAGKKLTNEDVMHKLRGEKGTKVKVAVMRRGEHRLLDYIITRDKIPLISVDVSYMVDKEIGYIKINRFSATTTDEFGKKLYELKQQGVKKLIVDLRQNPGGYLQAAVDIVDELIGGKQLVVYTKGNAFPRQDYVATKQGQFEEGALCILMDEGSASASEILSGAIQDHDRGTIIGRRSFGKGLVQEQYKLNDGSALRLTIARYYTPSGRCIQRNYGKNTEDYYNDILERYNNGEFFNGDSVHTKDSVVYFTDAGRKVYAGGGITPDIFVPYDTSIKYNYLADFRRFIPDYVINRYGTNDGIYLNYKSAADFNRSFVLDNVMLNDFLSYAYAKGVEKNEAALKNIDSLLRNTLKAYIAKEKWQNDGLYPVLNQSDVMFLKAVEQLKKEK